MNLMQLTSADLKQIAPLLEKREALEVQLAEIHGKIAAWQGEPSAPRLDHKTRTPRKQKPTRQATPGKRRSKQVQETAVTKTPADASPVSKAGRAGGRRPSPLRDAIVGLIKASGHAGISVKEIAARLGANAKNTYIWFFKTGKKIPQIKKVKPGTYRWNG